jgi:hypothetical protein
MPDSKTPETRLDRVARDLSRTLLHGARPTDTAGNVRPSTIVTGQQMQIDLPAGDMNFMFSAGGSSSPVTVDHAQAATTDQFMTDAVGASAATYMTLNVDRDIPTWVFQQRQFSLTNPPAAEDTVATPPFTALKLPSSVLQEVQAASGDSYISLWSMNPATQTGQPIPRNSWNPAAVVRFPLKQTAAVADAGTQVYELGGTPEGDRWFLDQLGLLPTGPVISHPPVITTIYLTLEKKDAASGKVVQTPPLAQWSIGRTNLTREARASQLMELAPDAVPAPSFPYIVLSGDAGQEQDAVRLLEMASITNSGGYFLGAATDWSDAQTLILTVILQPVADSDASKQESAWLPPAANAVALSGTTPDTIRFNGILQIEIAPYTPPGTVSFGWARTVLQDPSSLEDRFGYGTLSLVDYAASDVGGQPVPLNGAVPVISPLNTLPGDHYEELRPAGGSGLQDLGAPNSSAMRLLAPHQMNAAPAALPAPADAAATTTQYYRATLACYDKTKESPWQRLADPNRSQILLTPGFRDVFGNRFSPAAGPVFKRRMFYTDPIFSPAEWPGVRFAVYSAVQDGKPALSIEMSYDPTGADSSASRKQRLREICYQLRGVGNDVAVTLLADPLVGTVTTLDCIAIANQLQVWAGGDNTKPVLVLQTVVCDGSITAPTRFLPRIQITRTKAEYLPLATDLPADSDLSSLIVNRITSQTSPIGMQIDATPPPGGATQRRDEFRQVAKQFQQIVAGPLKLQAGFLRDQVNRHELWLIPNALFPAVSPDPKISSAWSFATPCPLSNVLGNDSFTVPDFTKTTATTNAWQTFPLLNQMVVDQDFDQLGRVALRMLETETADPGALMLRGNADTMRSLLKYREGIANQLSVFDGTGFIGSLFADSAPVDLDTAAVSRAAKDAFLGDLSSFYAVSTILQLPLMSPGSTKIQTFEGNISKTTWVGGDPVPPPTFSDVLLGGGDQKVTILYDLPAGATRADVIPTIDSLEVDISYVQLPLPGAPPGPSPFNEGPWVELATPFPLTWKGYAEYIPVAERVFPTKPLIQSTEALTAWMNPNDRTVQLPPKIDGTNAALLAQWGWKFAFGLIGAVDTDVVHINVLYPQIASRLAGLLDVPPPADWAPVSLLHSLFVLKSLHDNWDNDAVRPVRLPRLAQLAGFLSGFLTKGPQLSLQDAGSAGAPATLSDLFNLGFKAGAISEVSRKIMQGPIAVGWSSANSLDTATLVAAVGSPGNNACLTGTNPVRSYKVSLTLLRNEAFGAASPRPANKRLIYQCAPVESPLDCRPLNRWVPDASADALVFDIAGQPFQTALASFFGGLFNKADLSKLSIEAGISLAWSKGSLEMVTPFAILPADFPSAGGTADTLAGVVNGLCTQFLGPGLSPPSDADSASIRLRVKITAPDPDVPAGRRTLIEVTAIDFPLKTKPTPAGNQPLSAADVTPLAIADDILSYCVSLDNANDPVMTDCNAFVKKVGSHFGVAIPDVNADGIVDAFNAAPFSKTTTDPAIAMGWANDGLVVSGMKMTDLNPAYGTQYQNGHVAIGHATEDSVHHGFPMASWGTLGGRGQSNTSIRQSFPARACDDDAVHFAFAATS